jgi:preprotein translocase subunit YajC
MAFLSLVLLMAVSCFFMLRRIRTGEGPFGVRA